MKNKKLFLFAVFILFSSAFAFSSPLYSPTWGYRLDLPEGYDLAGGDRKDTFSFENDNGAKFDIAVYHAAPGGAAPYSSAEALAQNVKRKLNSSGDIDSFEYGHKKVFILELDFSMPGDGPMSGWGLCTELGSDTAQSGNSGPPPLLLALAYGPAGDQDLMALHLSALDSLVPEEGDRLIPGPITEFSYPRETPIDAPVFGLGISAHIYKEDAEAAQALVDREFKVLNRYADSSDWKDAWSRFYRAIYRDSFDRLADIAFQVERKLNVPPRENRDFADQALQWVQSFTYERDPAGSDFVNLVSAATEGRGDCDSRSMLWAVILKQAAIPSAIMVSRQYSHAMGLADLPGSGARFELDGKNFLVAETTAKVSIGLIAEDVSDTNNWLGIEFE